MKIAVFSDIHANYIAFQKCINYALEQRIDTFIFLGDYLGEFAYPQRTMDLIYSLKEQYTCFFIKGNKEDYWIKRRYDEDCVWKNGNHTVGALQYCYANLTDRDIAFFKGLSICQEIKLNGAAPLLACHGSPNHNNEDMLPDNDNTKRIMEECTQQYILCGHTHRQGVIEHAGKKVLNPGSVGVSLYGGGKAEFMILHQSGGEWEYEFVSLDYDRKRVIEELRESGLEERAPYWCQITKQLLRTGEVSHATVLGKAMKLCHADTGECKWYDIPDKYWERALHELNMKKQYKDSTKLSTRILLHSKYSVNKTGFGNWIISNYRIKEGMRILELGCGTGDMWKEHLDILDEAAELILTDFSEGMLKTARETLGERKNITYRVVNIEQIPFKDNSFDIVIANMMLYHVADIEKALSEVKRVLKSQGTFYCATYGEHGNIMEHVAELLKDDSLKAVVNKRFTLQNGRSLLEAYFSPVFRLDYEDALEITDVEDLMDYVCSLPSMANQENFDRAVAKHILEKNMVNGILSIPKEQGMFVCKK